MLLKVPARKKVVISLTPLIDVVFILLVFFMLASSFVDWRSYEVATGVPDNKPLPLNPPPSASGSAESTTANLLIKANGDWLIDGEKLSSRFEASKVLRQRLAEVPELVVIVKPDGEVPLQAAMDAFDTVQQVGVKAVSLRPGDSQ